jgi:DNA polymerase-1
MFPGMDVDGRSVSENGGKQEANAKQPDAKKPGRPGASSRAAGPAPTDRAEPPILEGQTVYAIDANSLIFQVFHAIPEMTSPRGEPVSAVYGFTRDVVKLIEEKKPDYLFVAFDRAEKTFRHEVFEDYKAHRAEVPVDLAPQFGAIVRLLHALGVCVLDCAGYEADDILATIAHQTDAAGGQCVLVTGDRTAAN